jgi:UDP-GlcNAc:undecaprenyl-phosphate GlcNAc-1-phosphate transferase
MGFWGECAALCLIAALAAALGAWCASRSGPVDQPNARSSHVRPRPRAGGLGLVLGCGVAALALALGLAPDIAAALGDDSIRFSLILAAAALAGAVGVSDDLSLIGLGAKFAGIGAASLLGALAAGPVITLDAGFAVIALPYWLALPGGALWVFVILNAVNFMDGTDGMFAACMAVAGAGLAALGILAGAPVALLCGALLAASLLGFAPFNMPKARVFAGDSGALFGAALFAAGALDLAARAPGAVWVAPLLVAPFLADVFATLIARARRGARLTEGHREHVYQLLTAGGWPHLGVAALYAGLGMACAATAAFALRAGPGAALVALVTLGLCGFAAALWVRGPLVRSALA